jgi:hypothetical protein
VLFSSPYEKEVFEVEEAPQAKDLEGESGAGGGPVEAGYPSRGSIKAASSS